jgi:hypothetical protein
MPFSHLFCGLDSCLTRSYARKLPKPHFECRPFHGMPSRLESHCLLCLEFVAAKDRREDSDLSEIATLS